jgi:8-amino-7-oxononanoate synthase
VLDYLQQQLREREAQALTRVRRQASTPAAPRQTIDGRPMLAFCSNDYLGLAQHPKVVAALQEGARRYGAGSGASHLISGHSVVHQMLEDRLAVFVAQCIPGAQALSFSTGYMANLAAVTALGGEGTDIFSERLNHACLIDGARLARGRKQVFGSVDELADQLRASTAPRKLIASDAVFSMDGHLAPLAALLALSEQHDALLLVDDAHGFGVLGPQGRGSLAQLGLSSERLVLMGTLGKAAGVAGAFVAAHPVVVEWLVQTARSYIFTTAAPPALAHALLTSLDLIEGDEGERRRAQLELLQAQLVEGLTPIAQARGWQLPRSDTPIQPLIVGDNQAALDLAARLDAAGIRVPAIRPPTVAAGTARLRITLCADHTADDVQTLVAALGQV